MVDIAIHLGGRMSVEQSDGIDQSLIYDEDGEIGFAKGEGGYEVSLGGIPVRELNRLPKSEFKKAEPVSKNRRKERDWETGGYRPSGGY